MSAIAGPSTSDSRRRLIAPILLVVGALLGMAGTFVPSANLRALCWGVDGTALTVAAALLTIHHVRRGNDPAAAVPRLCRGRGFDSFRHRHGPRRHPSVVRGRREFVGRRARPRELGASHASRRSRRRTVGSLLFAVVAVQIFCGNALTPLSRPLPFFAYPFLAATLFGWAWAHYRSVD